MALLLIGVHVLLLLWPGPFEASWPGPEMMGLGLLALPVGWAYYRMRNDPVRPVDRADELESALAGAAAQIVAACGFAALFLLSVASQALSRLLPPPDAINLLAWLTQLMPPLQVLVLGPARMLAPRE